MSLTFQVKRYNFGVLNTEIDEAFLKDIESPRIENFDLETIGGALTIRRRRGLSLFAQITDGLRINNIFQWNIKDGFSKLLCFTSGSGIGTYRPPNTYETTASVLYYGSGNDQKIYTTCVPYLHDLYIANGLNKISRWKAARGQSGITEITAAPRSKIAVVHKNTLWGFNQVTQGNSLVSTILNDEKYYQLRDLSFRANFSNIVDFDTWPSTNFIDFDGTVTAAASAAVGVLVVFQEARTGVNSSTTNTATEIITGSDPSDFAKFTLDNSVGSSSHFGTVNAEGKIIFPSQHGIFETSGLEKPKYIAQGIERVLEKIPPGSYKYIQGCYDPDNRRVILLVKYDDNIIGKDPSLLNCLLVRNLRTTSWHVHKLPEAGNYTCIAPFLKSNGKTAILVGANSGEFFIWDNPIYEDRFGRAVGSFEPIISVYETKPLTMDTPDLMKKFHKVRVFLKNQSVQTLTLTIYTDLNESRTVTIPTMQRTRSNDVLGSDFRLGASKTGKNAQDFVDAQINLRGHFLKIKFSTLANASVDFKGFYFDVYFEPLSRMGSPENAA